jgi:hypothetical protein
VQLRAVAGFALLTLLADGAPAAADSTISLRGAYYKERSTRVAQPMMDAALEMGEHGVFELHALVDSITSASPAAGAAGGAAFTEKRYELGGGYRHELPFGRVGGGLRASDESDYTSLFGHLRGELDLARKNTVLALGLAAGRDRATNGGAQGITNQTIGGVLHTTMASVAVSQLVSRSISASLGYDVLYLDGFQENPYRVVPAGGTLELERVPDRRWRHALVAGVRGFVPATGTTLIGSYRFYVDDWGVLGHTPEARVVQDLVPGLDLALRYRYHRQRAADFYEPIYDTADPMVEPFLSGDVKLSRMHTHTAGAKLGLVLGVLGVTGSWAEARADVGVDKIWQSTYVGDAIAAQLGLTVPFESR